MVWAEALEKLNGAKKNLTKLQFLMDLPARLQRCVRTSALALALALDLALDPHR